MALLLGPEDADAAAAGERAREVFASLGARPFLDRLESAMATEQGSAGPVHRSREGADARVSPA
jgi:hypothetical protein